MWRIALLPAHGAGGKHAAVQAVFPTLRQAGKSMVDFRPRFANAGTFKNPDVDFLAALGITDNPLARRVNEVSALSVSTVFACVSYISRVFATIPVDVYRRVGSSRELAIGHPIRELLARPNDVSTEFDVRQAMQHGLSLHGNGYALIAYDRAGRARQLIPLDSRLVSQETPANSRFPIYRYDGKTYNFSDIFTVRGASRDAVNGLSVLNYASPAIGMAQALDGNAAAFFANGSRPGLVYTMPAGARMTEPQQDALKRQLDAYKIAEKQFSTLVLQGGGTIEQLRMSNEAAQFDEIKKTVKLEICQVFGVPPHKVGILDNATFSNIEQQQIQAVQDLFLPICTNWEQALTAALLTPAERASGLYCKFTLAGLQRGDFAGRMAGYSTGLQNGIFSINDVRAWEELNPIVGGDTHVRQLNMTDINAPAVSP